MSEAKAVFTFKDGDVDVALTGDLSNISPQLLYRAGRMLNKLYMVERAKHIFAQTNKGDTPPEKKDKVEDPKPLTKGIETATKTGPQPMQQKVEVKTDPTPQEAVKHPAAK